MKRLIPLLLLAALVLAGLPGDPSLADGYKAAGVDDFIHVRADVTATLGQILSSLEASA